MTVKQQTGGVISCWFVLLVVFSATAFTQQGDYSPSQSSDELRVKERRHKVHSLEKVLRQFEPKSKAVRFFRCEKLTALMHDVDPSSAHISLELAKGLPKRECKVDDPEVFVATCEFDNGVCFVDASGYEYVWLDTINLCDCHAKCGDTPAPCN